MEKKAWPYVAGLLDAEGTIYVAVDKRPNGIIGISLQIIITNTDLRIMKWLVSNFGGKFYRKKNQRGYSTINSPDIYFWYVFGKANQEAFLLGILTHLRAKKQECVLALEFVRMSGWNKERKLQIAAEVKAVKIGDVLKDRQENLVRLSLKEEAAFAAGLFDGDGSIGSTVEVTQKRLILIRWLLMCFGGRFQERRMNGDKTYYRWYLSGKKNKEQFLLRLIPYLLLKKRAAIDLLETLRLRSIESSATTDMLGIFEPSKMKTQSELTGDSKSEPVKTQDSINK